MKKYLLTILLTIYICLPYRSNASTVAFELNSTKIEVGNQYELAVVFNGQTTNANGIEARIIVPVGLFSDIKIKDGNSAVSMWVQKPDLEIINGVGVINFSAINPSGINGRLFTILFTGSAPNSGLFTFEGNMLLADGKGTRVGLEPQNLSINVLPASHILGAENQNNINYDSDNESPEDFSIIVTHDERIYSNQWFAVFNTQDKNSGISHYEAIETDSAQNPEQQKGWETTKSPYLFKNQPPKKFLYIKAVDRNGNYRIATWQNPDPTNINSRHNIKIYVIIIVIFLMLISIIFELYLRRHKKQNFKS